MNTNGLSNNMPLLFIDIGSDNVKFTQPILNAFSISNLLRDGQNKSNKNQQGKNKINLF
jgi:hypothetical protein